MRGRVDQLNDQLNRRREESISSDTKKSTPDYIHYHPKDSSNQAVDSVLREREVAVQLLKSNLGKAQERMKAQADKHCSEKYYEPYRKHSVNRRAFHKLAAKYYGPYEITKKVGTVAYQLKLPQKREYIMCSMYPS
ncbi:hypothetical protein OSB04_012004 [Centaurea solstitialis]|uniref:Tf2-1-like SH3-like domain-containing protein n=1 Tax=Centaurea solstitialis TaxID=347529 RepID=A0AA38WM20_9ASTR|nr:hypothetical protein OSB04_012004 [Centaurea solstitialis]